MFFKKILYVVLFIIGVGLLGLGLLFLMGSGGQSSRSLTGFVMLGVGVASLIGGSGLRSSVIKNMPSMIDADMIRLASRSDGRISVGMVVSDLHITRGQALESLDRLSGNGTARPEPTDDGVIYIFERVKPKRKIRKCVYCGAEYPVSKPITKCENCGGEVKIIEQ